MGNPNAVAAGDDVLAAWGNDALSRLVLVFASAAARDSALPSPEDGRIVYTEDDDVFWYRVAGKWDRNDAGRIVAFSDHAADYPPGLSTSVYTAHPTITNGESLQINPQSGRFTQLAIEQNADRMWVRGRNDAAGWTELPLPEGNPGVLHVDRWGGLEFHGSTPGLGLVLESTGQPQLTGLPTATGTPLVLHANGRIILGSSSRRYKRDITDWAAPSALPSTLKRWRYRSDVDELGDQAPYRVGPIAEDVHDAGLVEFVNYDDQGRPDSLDIGSLALAHTAALEAKVAALEAKVAALEAS